MLARLIRSGQTRPNGLPRFKKSAVRHTGRREISHKNMKQRTDLFRTTVIFSIVAWFLCFSLHKYRHFHHEYILNRARN